MSTIGVVFDVPDEFYNEQHGIHGETIIQYAVMGWVEHNCPTRYSAKLDKDDIIATILSEFVDPIRANDFDNIFHNTYEVFEYVDKFLSKIASPHELITLKDVSFMGDSCLVRLDPVSDELQCTRTT